MFAFLVNYGATFQIVPIKLGLIAAVCCSFRSVVGNSEYLYSPLYSHLFLYLRFTLTAYRFEHGGGKEAL